MDKYCSYDDLKRHEQEGVDYRIRFRRGDSQIVIVAPHGGLIEPGTSQIAEEIAGSEHTLYCFEGLKAGGNYHLHIRSTHFDEPGCITLVQSAWKVVTIHGARELDEAVYIGGLDETLKARIHAALALAGFVAEEDIRAGLRGRSAHNICNRAASGTGAQIEISRGLRERMFRSPASEWAEGRSEVFYALTSAIRQVLAATARRPISGIQI